VPGRREDRVRRVGGAFLFLLLLLGLSCLAQEASDAFQVDMQGQKTWTLRYGLGDALALAPLGMGSNQLTLDQSLAVDITGKAFSILTIKAHFNDQEPATMQTLTVSLDTDELKGVFGDFSISGKEAFAVYNKKLKGARLDYRIGEATLTGIVSRIEGISESQTFVGRTAHDEVLFSRTLPAEPWREAPYLKTIEGLYHYRLARPFVEGFSQVEVEFVSSAELGELLVTYDLGYLVDTIESAPAEDLSLGSFVAVSDAGDFLLLKSEPGGLLRERLRAYIKAYNEEHDLAGEERKTYPFNAGTDYERVFLDRLAAFANLVVDGDPYLLANGERHRFYYLGQTDITEDSVVVEVALGGGTFRAISEPDLSDYRATPYLEAGVVEFDFPESFFADARNEARVSFDYAISGGVFQLGLALVQGSEKVYLNGKLLVRDTDYTIDYDIGTLILFTEVGEEDTIRIDYERSRGGLGSSAEYSSNFYGASLELPLSEAVTLELSALQAADSPTPLVDPDQARTMPNRQTVCGLVGTVTLDGFSADVTLGLNYDRFPFDNNARRNLSNEVTSLLSLSGYTFASHLGGISVYEDGEWTAYDTSDGLSGSRVYDMTSDGERVFFATASGLTVLSLEGEAPLARVGNWRRYYQSDGLPNSSVRAVLLVEGTLWVGTEGGLASVLVHEIDDPASWKIYVDEPFLALGEILHLAGDGKTLYIAAEQGLFRLDVETGTLVQLPGTEGLVAEDLLLDGDTLYVACGLGIRSFHDGVGTGWIVFGKAVHALASVEGELWYGTDDGLYRASGGAPPITGWAITALAVDQDGAVWIGSKADADYRLAIWREDGGLERFESDETGIDGRDLSRFADIPAEGHTDEGFLGRFDFHREMGTFSLSGSFESVSPTFTSIGRLDRRDSTGWELSATARPFEGLDLALSHSYYLVDVETGHPASALASKASLTWDFGPRLDLSFGLGLGNDDRSHQGFDNASLSYALGLSGRLFGETLDLSLRVSDAFTANLVSQSLDRDSLLRLEGTWALTRELSLGASWARPMAASGGEESKEETWGGRATWSHAFDPFQVTLNYTGSASHTLAGADWRTQETGRLEVAFARIDLVAWQFTPGLDASIEEKEGILSLSARGTLRGSLAALTARGAYSVEISGLGEAREQRTDRLSVSLDYSGFAHLKPSLTYTETVNAVIYQGEARPTLTRTLSGRLAWTPAGGTRDDLSVVVRGMSDREEEKLSVTVRNSFSHAVSEPLFLRIDLEGNYDADEKGADLDLDLKGSADLVLSETWRTSLSLSYLGGTKSDGGLFHGLLVELFVAASF
jgi:hypothetical protein